MQWQKMLELDASLSSRLRVADRPGKLRSIAVILAHSGDSWFWLAGLGLVWLLGTDFWRARALAHMLGILLTALLVMSIKFTVRRRRPEGEWGSIYRSTDPHSFPSGHAARAMMLAVLAVSLGPSWAGILLMIWAPLVVLARVSMGVHYLSDVLAGALFGVLMGLVLGAFLPGI
jgi:undecaprenyl-diphosphatase